MSLISLTCNKCGAQLQVDDSRDFYFCQYCGNKLMVDKKVVIVENKSTVKSLMTRAEFLLQDGKYSYAGNLYNEVLEIDPYNIDAYLGILLAKYKTTTIRGLQVLPIDYDGDPDYERLISFDEAEKYRVINESQLHKDALMRERLKKDNKILKQRIEETEKYIKEKSLYLFAGLWIFVFIIGVVGFIVLASSYNKRQLPSSFLTLYVGIGPFILIGIMIVLHPLSKRIVTKYVAKKGYDLDALEKRLRDNQEWLRTHVI